MTERAHRVPRGPIVRRSAPWGVVPLLVGACLLLAGCTAAEPPAVANTYGGMPSYLRSAPGAASDDTDAVLDGSADAPALTSEGDPVRVRLADGASVLATVTGPVVPGEGLPHQGETTTCTWTVTLRGATREVPIDVAQMTTSDQLGNTYGLAPVAGEPSPPSTLGPGQRVTFDLRTTMKVGEGLLRWAPDGTHPVAEWDFEVEND